MTISHPQAPQVMDIPWPDGQMLHHPLAMLCLLITRARLVPAALTGRLSLPNCSQVSFAGSSFFSMPPMYQRPFHPRPTLGRLVQIKNLIHSFSPPPGVPESRGNAALSNVQAQFCIWKEILTSVRKKTSPDDPSSWREILTWKY